MLYHQQAIHTRTLNSIQQDVHPGLQEVKGLLKLRLPLVGQCLADQAPGLHHVGGLSLGGGAGPALLSGGGGGREGAGSGP